MRPLLWLSLLATGCANLAQSSMASNQSGASSNASANSSANSGTSNTSAQSSNGSNASSMGSQASSNASNTSSGTSNTSSGTSAQSSQSSQNSSGSVQSSLQSSNASSGAPSSTIVAGSALLLGVVGGIITTVYSSNQRRAARLQREQFKQQPQPGPQPMPYKVEPIPLEPGGGQLPPPEGPPPPPPPPPPPEFQPAPFPQSGLPEGEPTIDAMVLAQYWLKANELQLKQDLALGAGPAIDDLAGIAGISPSRRAHFGKVLQRHRARLITPHDVTPQQASQVMSRVGDLVMADPLLRVDGEALLAALPPAAHGGQGQKPE